MDDLLNEAVVGVLLDVERRTDAELLVGRVVHVEDASQQLLVVGAVLRVCHLRQLLRLELILELLQELARRRPPGGVTLQQL